MSQSVGEDWFVLVGRISHFQWAEGRENLLEQIQQRSQLKNAAAGAAAAALNMYGTLATSAMVAMYDGEYTENFACSVDGKVVCGTFRGARKLRNGDHVRMVVRPLENGVLDAFAIQRPNDELLWLPSQVRCGDKAARRDYLRSTIRSNLFVWLLFAVIGIGFVLFDERVKLSYVIYFEISMIFVFPLLSWLADYLPGRVGKESGEIGSKIFTLLDFPDPDNLNMLLAGMTFQDDEPQQNDIHMYRLALDAHSNGTKIITRFDRRATQYEHKAQEEKSQKKTAKSPKKRTSR